MTLDRYESYLYIRDRFTVAVHACMDGIDFSSSWFKSAGILDHSDWLNDELYRFCVVIGGWLNSVQGIFGQDDIRLYISRSSCGIVVYLYHN